ncbi:SDR family oxidoreductase [Frondihabitans peucedani]|uniref:2-dehydro-3-deoxy-D-gluconate 5-dehydrogenase KduD n=1 Tax=Frondihabitans peucedani TaxID=598626 RepID=A0ABP8E4P9_9MICO
MFDLTGRTALVTGCSRGLGLAMAAALASAGADIVGVSATLAAEGSEAERRVRATGRSFEGHAVDFADRDAVLRFARTVTEGDRAIDILIDNAGTIERHPAEEHPLDAWDRLVQVNLSNQFALTQAVAPGMLARGWGRVVFTASMLSFQGGRNVSGYTATKSAIAGLTKSLSNEWSGRGVTVNAIAPGYFRTDNTQALQDDPDRAAGILGRIPAGRWGEPDDLAGAVVFLASDAAAYVTGVTLPVDGGWLAS